MMDIFNPILKQETRTISHTLTYTQLTNKIILFLNQAHIYSWNLLILKSI
jgi:hypothetical protein